MSTVRWKKSNGQDTLKHIEGLGRTLCGVDIPARKEWSFFGIPECKRCIAAQEKHDKLYD